MLREHKCTIFMVVVVVPHINYYPPSIVCRGQYSAREKVRKECQVVHDCYSWSDQIGTDLIPIQIMA